MIRLKINPSGNFELKPDSVTFAGGQGIARSINGPSTVLVIDPARVITGRYGTYVDAIESGEDFSLLKPVTVENDKLVTSEVTSLKQAPPVGDLNQLQNTDD